MKIHYLKATTEHFEPICDGLKTAEFRKNDRDFRVGDVLFLQEFDAVGGLSGWAQMRIVTHVACLDKVGAVGYVLLSMRVLTYEEAEKIKKFTFEYIENIEKMEAGESYENPDA